jgi:hypothetical protein
LSALRNEVGKAWKRPHPVRVKFFVDHYRKAHPEKVREWEARYWRKKAEKGEDNRQQCRRAYHQQNKQKYNEKAQQWALNNPVTAKCGHIIKRARSWGMMDTSPLQSSPSF